MGVASTAPESTALPSPVHMSTERSVLLLDGVSIRGCRLGSTPVVLGACTLVHVKGKGAESLACLKA